MNPVTILGIETSCDETAVALVRGTGGVTPTGEILAHVCATQTHQPYGGVVPEVASRCHLEQIGPLVDAVFTQAGMDLGQVDAVAVTAGPGLIGGVMVGMMFGKALALGAGKPFLAINHLEGHALTPRLTHHVAFPYLLLLMSGGHTQFLLAKGIGDYHLLGTSRDDALGETFDKSARLLGFPYPGGPQIEKAAQTGDPQRFSFPNPLFRKPGCDFSFSGLKSAVARTIQQLPPSLTFDSSLRADLAASFQETVAQILEDRLGNAVEHAQNLCPTLSTLVLAGGVAANRFLFQRLSTQAQPLSVVAPPIELCTDNGVMIAWAGVERFGQKLWNSLDFAPRPRWPLEELRQEEHPCRV